MSGERLRFDRRLRGFVTELRAGQQRTHALLEHQQRTIDEMAARLAALEATVLDAASAAGLIDRRNAHYDAWTEEIIERVLRPGSTGVDVGAHAGLILRSIVKAAPDGRHHAFEPIPHLAEQLRVDFPDVEVHQVALSDTAGSTTFHHVVSNPSFSGILERDYQGPEDVALIDVELARMDDLIPEDTAVHLIKIDVEGAELGVLRGATRIIDAHHPVVVFELGPGASNHYGTTPGDVHRFFADHDMAVSLLDAYLHGGPTLSADQLDDEYNSLRNYYFVAHPAGTSRR